MLRHASPVPSLNAPATLCWETQHTGAAQSASHNREDVSIDPPCGIHGQLETVSDSKTALASEGRPSQCHYHIVAGKPNHARMRLSPKHMHLARCMHLMHMVLSHDAEAHVRMQTRGALRHRQC